MQGFHWFTTSRIRVPVLRTFPEEIDLPDRRRDGVDPNDFRAMDERVLEPREVRFRDLPIDVDRTPTLAYTRGIANGITITHFHAQRGILRRLSGQVQWRRFAADQESEDSDECAGKQEGRARREHGTILGFLFFLAVTRILREFAVGLQRRWRWILFLAAPPALVALGLSIDGWRDRIEPVDLLIVPGSMVHPDGTLSRNLHGRLLSALEYHRTGNSRWILVSGGTGEEGRDESLAMRDFLIANQVPDSVIIVDGDGVNTFETARFAARWMREHDAKTVGVASSYFHVTRLRLALSRHGISMSGHIHSRLYEPRDLYSVAREVPGLVSYLFKKP